MGVDRSTDFGGQVLNSGRDSRAETVVQAIMVPIAIAFGLWLLVVTWTAFVGGRTLLFLYEFMNVNLILGLFWLFMVDPILVSIGYWTFMLIALPIIGLATGVKALSRKNHASTTASMTSTPSTKEAKSDYVTGSGDDGVQIIPAQIGSVHVWMESETGPGELHLGSDGAARFIVTGGSAWNLGNLNESASDYRISEDGNVVMWLKPPMSIMLWTEPGEAQELIEFLTTSSIPKSEDSNKSDD